MTEEELAAFVRDIGSRVVRCDNVWWVENQPCFFRTLVPMIELVPSQTKYPRRTWLGGAKHAVPKGSTANSVQSYFIDNCVAEYSLAKVGHSHANKIRKGLKNFHWRRIDNLDHFNLCAYPVYLVFLQRTGYRYKQERRSQPHFEKWARALFANPKVGVCGAYQGERLVAVSIHYLLEKMFIHATYFSDNESQHLRIFDFVVHNLREEAAASGANLLFLGPQTGVDGIDRAKLDRGFSLVTQEANLRINPLIDVVLKTFGSARYLRLKGVIPSS
jgi:hypothetical protein